MIKIWYSIILCENKYSTFLLKNKTTTKEELTTLEVVRRNPGGGRIQEKGNAPLVLFAQVYLWTIRSQVIDANLSNFLLTFCLGAYFTHHHKT